VIVPKQSISQQVARFGPLVPLLICAGLTQSILTTALPPIVSDLNGLSLYSWVTWAYVIALALTLPFWTYILTLLPQKTVLKIGVLLYVIGLGISGLSTSLDLHTPYENGMVIFLLGRVIQGVGMSSAVVWAFSIFFIEEFVLKSKTIRALLVLSPIIYLFGLISGPYLGGLLSDHASWRWIFGFLLIVILPVLLSEKRDDVTMCKRTSNIVVFSFLFVLMPVISLFPYAIAVYLLLRRTNLSTNKAVS
jgi:MFS family permease